MKALAPVTLSSSLCFWLLSVSSLCTLCFCNQNSNHAPCIATERLVLIQLKNNLIDHANRLSSWVGNDCCSWSGVVCNNITGNVQEIRLRGPDDGFHGHCHGPYDTDDELEEASKQMLGGTISPSVTKLLQLMYFDISCNDFGFIPIPAFFGSFQNLRYLNISKSQFSGEIPHQLGNLSKLRVLDLHDVPLAGNLHSKSLKWLKDLQELQYLDMGSINLARALDWFQVISTLPSLLEIHCSLCGLIQLPSNPTKVSFTSLVVLDLSYNSFSDSLLPQWIFSLHNLVLLDLTNCNIGGLNPGIRADFNSMPSLRTLSVSTNPFVNSSSLLNGLSSLSNLRLLDVSNCNISAPILGNLHNLSFIVHLDLSNNQIVEEIPKSLSNLCNLNTLDLQSNNFFGNVSELLERFCECESPKLELLALRGNYVTGQLPEKLGRLKNLESIDLAYNQLTGPIPDSVGSLHLLKTLQMNINQLTGSIPDTIGGLSSLNFLDLSYNNLNGSFPESIGRLGELVFLTVHHNSLTGIVTKNHFTNLTSLTTLWIGDNKLTFKLNVKNWKPPFKLQVLRIGSCNLGPRFPLWIQSQRSLTDLDLANTNISDLPNWIWTTFSSVTYFNISHNNIQGMLGNVSFLTPGALLDLSYNSFHGLLPGHFNRPDLDVLDLSSNSLSGSLEEFLCSGIQEPRRLSVLNLANNNMSGVISDCWTNWESLVILNLEKNQFSGRIPSSIGNISSLLSLDIRQNKLSGNLPVSLLNSKSLIIIELAENELVGRIPTSIGRENTSLKLLSLRSNKLEGKIPDEICYLSSIQIMDLAHNDLSGNLPTCFTNLTVISGKEKPSPFILYDELFQNQVLGSASLVTKGRVSTYDNILYLVTTLDLSNNKFSGSIPDELVSLLGLRFLNLSKNNLTGQIPNSFSKTGMLESLDLSVNHLNGNIPSSLSSLTSLSFLDVSYNNLEGRIPTGPQLQTFNESSFIGNKLCGDPLPVCSPNTNDPRGTDDEHDESDGIDWILVIFTLLGLVIGFWIMIAPLIVSKRWRNAYYHFLEGIWIKLQNSILIIFPCFRRRKPGHEVFSSIEQVQQFDLSQYIYDDKLKGFHPESSSSEASSSTQNIRHSDNKKA